MCRITVAEAEAKAKEYLREKFQGAKNLTVKSIDRTDGDYILKGELTRKFLFPTLKRHFKIEIGWIYWQS